jgi:(2Fe-2S) ferredoxin
MPNFTHHIFVCCNQRPQGHPRGSCDPSGAAELQQLFKRKLAEHGLAAGVRANKAGCLDQCEHGPTVVIYPEGIWYGGVRPADVDEIVGHLIAGCPLARLQLDEPCINTPACAHKPRPASS